ncbi:MAG TPA: lysozyme inhibitor LprI family protein [Candidatus Sulfotelmatobacter sp.]|nr:lysozyme inhibitor LprI family protein [Candidatus Sulfotelmatobacter sp.]
MKIVALVLLFPFLPRLVVAQQPVPNENPCDEKPISQRQMDDCAAFEYKQADAHLNKVYRKAVEYMTDDRARAQKVGDQKQVKYEETAIASLKEAERTWISYRDIQCKAAAQQYEGGSMAPMIYSQCLTTLTKHRSADLKSIYEDGDRKLD